MRARGRVRRRHDVAGRRATATSRASRARAAEHTHRRRDRLPARRRSPRGRRACPRSILKHVQADDRRHRHASARRLQHPALRRRLLPRRQRAGAAADDAARGRRHATTRRSSARWRRAISPSSATPSTATSGRFRNFLSYARQWLEPCGSEDSHGRALWALGAVVGRAGDPGRHSLAGELFHAALPAVTTFTSPRAWAYALLGIDEYLRAFQGDSTRRGATRRSSPSGCSASSSGRADPTGRGSRTRVTYCNARLSQALIVSGDRMHRRDMIDAGLRSLEWLVSRAIVSGRPLRARSDPTASIERGASPGGLRPAAGRGLRDGLGVPRRLPRAAATAAGQSTRGARSTGFSARTTCSTGSTTRRPAAAATGCTPTAPTRTRARNRRSRSCSRLHEMRGPITALDVHGAPARELQADIMTSTAAYEILFHRHDGKPDPDGGRLAVSGTHGVQRRGDAASTTARRCCSAGSKTGAATRISAPRDRANGVDGWIIDAEPTLWPDPERYPEELWGIEDPRITFVEELGQVRRRLHRVQPRRARRRAGAHRGLPPLRAPRPRHAAGRQGRGAAAASHQRQLRPAPSPGDGLGRARLDFVLAGPAQLGRPQAGAAGAARRLVGCQQASACRRRSSRRRAAG